MPKELIATRTENDTAADGTVLETRTDSLYVAWGRQPGADGEAVQVTIRQETDRTGRELYSAGLTRAEINDLIRVLKRAQRQTFEAAVFGVTQAAAAEASNLLAEEMGRRGRDTDITPLARCGLLTPHRAHRWSWPTPGVNTSKAVHCPGVGGTGATVDLDDIGRAERHPRRLVAPQPRRPDRRRAGPVMADITMADPRDDSAPLDDFEYARCPTCLSRRACPDRWHEVGR